MAVELRVKCFCHRKKEQLNNRQMGQCTPQSKLTIHTHIRIQPKRLLFYLSLVLHIRGILCSGNIIYITVRPVDG